jgi:hypothetical protein
VMVYERVECDRRDVIAYRFRVRLARVVPGGVGVTPAGQKVGRYSVVVH